MKTKRVLVADDSALARQTIRSVLEEVPKPEEGPKLEVVGEAEDGSRALALARALVPDLILMDIDMPRCDGLLATRLIKRELPGAVVVVLTVSDDAHDLLEAVRSGAQGYLTKDLDVEDWLGYLRGLLRNEVMPRDLTRRIMARFTLGEAPAEAHAALTEREREVLHLVARAMTNKQVASALYISEQTVKNHVKNVMQKLRSKNRVELALHAKRLGMGVGSLANGAMKKDGGTDKIAPMGDRTSLLDR